MRAGFSSSIRPYHAGHPFLAIAELSKKDLEKVVCDHTRELRSGENNRDESCALFGGYVLKADGKDIFFPQCCSDLTDIHSWKQLLESNAESYFYAGHPGPVISKKRKLICLDFRVEKYGERFCPPPPVLRISIHRTDLQNAIEEADLVLKQFALRLREINDELNLGIDDLDALLIDNN